MNATFNSSRPKINELKTFVLTSQTVIRIVDVVNRTLTYCHTHILSRGALMTEKR